MKCRTGALAVAAVLLGMIGSLPGAIGAGAGTMEATGRHTERSYLTSGVVGRIRGAAPSGWSVAKDGNEVILSRDQPLLFLPYNLVINAPPSQTEAQVAYKSQYRIRLRFGRFISPAKYRKLHAAKLAEEASADAGLSAEERSSFKHAMEERERILKEALSPDRLPDFHTGNSSIYLTREPLEDPFASGQRKEGEECKEVLRKVESLFTRY